MLFYSNDALAILEIRFKSIVTNKMEIPIELFLFQKKNEKKFYSKACAVHTLNLF